MKPKFYSQDVEIDDLVDYFTSRFWDRSLFTITLFRNSGRIVEDEEPVVVDSY
jgi:hypothetical protein